MLGIGREAAIFLYAVLSGMAVMFSYEILRLLRRLVRHPGFLVGLEDFCFFMGVSIYLFRQMYRTTYGTVRWFFTLGVVCGIVLSFLILLCAKRLLQKAKKNLDKSGKNS